MSEEIDDAPLRWEERADGLGETSYCELCDEPIYMDEPTEHDPQCAWRLKICPGRADL